MNDEQRQPRELTENVTAVVYRASSTLPWLVEFWSEPVEPRDPEEYIYSYQRHERYASFRDVLAAHGARIGEQ